MTSRNGSSISFYSYNLPNTINAGESSSQFFYGPTRARYKQVANYAGTTETTLYVAGLLEKMTRGTVTEYRHYIPAGPATTAVYTRRTSGTAVSTYYVSKDHLGSSSAVTSSSGAMLANLSFGALGQRRSAAWNGSPSTADWNQITATTRQGFTGHEHLDNLSLVHMNGRVYDPYIGRFLSADPFIDGGLSTQGYNRYSYVLNGSLSSIDPSGFRTCGPEENAPDCDEIREHTLTGGGGGSSSPGYYWGGYSGGISSPGMSGGGGEEAIETVVVTAKLPCDDSQQCYADCIKNSRHVVRGLAGVVGGATTGLLTGGVPGMLAGAAVGGVTSTALSFVPDNRGAQTTAAVGLAAAGAYAEHRLSGKGTPAGTIGAIAGEFVGGAIGGENGAAYGGFVGGTVGGALAQAGPLGKAILSFRGGAAGLIGGMVYSFANEKFSALAEPVCASLCGL